MCPTQFFLYERQKIEEVRGAALMLHFEVVLQKSNNCLKEAEAKFSGIPSSFFPWLSLFLSPDGFIGSIYSTVQEKLQWYG